MPIPMYYAKGERTAIIEQESVQKKIAEWVNFTADFAHHLSRDAGWYNNIETGEELEVDIPQKLFLIVSEVVEAGEGHRKNLMDDKLPHRKMLEVELADALIRIGDLAGALGLDLGGAVAEKMAYNAKRLDHKPENRRSEGGKKF